MSSDSQAPREVRIPAPPQVFDVDGMSRGERCISAVQAGHLVVLYYEPASLTAALFYPAAELWTVLGPMSFGELVKSLPARQLVLDMNRMDAWIDECGGLAPAIFGVH